MISRIDENTKTKKKQAKEKNMLSMIEVKCTVGARSDLGRPTTTAMDNKKIFMKYVSGKS